MNHVLRPMKKSEIDDTEFLAPFYDKEQLQHFLECLESEGDKRMYLIFRMFAFTGLRRGKLLALRWKDVDLERSALSVNQALTRDETGQMHFQTLKNKQSIQTISLNAKTVGYMKKWKAFQRQFSLQKGINTAKGDQLVFTDEFNEHLYLDYTYKFLKNFLKRHDLPKITNHGFRHTIVAYCSKLGHLPKRYRDVLAIPAYKP